MASSGQSCCDWLRQGHVTQMGTMKVIPETAWNYWESAPAFLVRYELGAARDTGERQNCMGMKSSPRKQNRRETGERRVLSKQFGPAISKVSTTPGLFNVPFFVLLQVEDFLLLFFLSLVSGKGLTSKSNHLQIPRDPWRLLCFLVGKTFLAPVFLPTLGFSERFGAENEKQRE